MITVGKKATYFIILIFLGTSVYNALKLFKADKNKFYTSSKPITLNGAHNKVISNLDIKGGEADCIKLTNCYNITIKDCRLYSSKENGADLINSKNITIINCYFENTETGVYAYKSEGIKITHNLFKNMQGPLPKGQMVQFNEVYGKGNRVNFNKCENNLGAANPEDVINMYKTNGTVNDLIQIIGNQIRGGGPSKTGGGIMLGDNGGSYMIVQDNILVDPGQYGIAIAGGTNIQVVRNEIFGKKQPFTNVGIYIWNQHTSGCALNTITNNKVNFTNSHGDANHSWDSGNCGKVTGWETNTWGAEIDAKILPVNIVN